MKKVNSILLSLVMLGAAGGALGQTGTTPGGGVERRTAVRSDAGVAPVVPSMLEPITTAALLDARLVRNKPLEAVFESKTTQILANGASDARRVMTIIYRDGAGRTRREQIFYAGSSGGAAPVETARHISISDPVAGYGYSVNPATRTVQRYPLPSTPQQQQRELPFNNRLPTSVEILRNDNQQTGTVRRYTLEPPRPQSLGRQRIAGIDADGWRLTIKVPTGAVGNAAPVETIYETWVAGDLQMLVKASVRNSVNGEHTLDLTTINRAEPPRSRFEVPAGYTVIDMGVTRTDLTPPL